ncbi:sugar transferase [Finegoldia magna]|uniref:Sugar transferase n=1 Tax=Finegoldia magna TaxID=1260 RepID=A0A2N6SSY5_FINMA|nr:sugar transferase [Finegoldia magna]MDU7385732.1 sugar transferase [Finegoldia magna]PMC60192.1 sugar transferase [Finegoldia magna]
MFYQKILKRVIDFFVSLIISPIVLIICIIFGLLIYIEDKGDIFYISERRGINGSVFKMYKLRSMKLNSPDLRNPDGSTYNSNKDERLTKTGKLIRKLSIDELPQIFNVLKGEMSFIGPRPSLVSMRYDELDEYRKKRLNVLPGITGYSQAYYRNTISQSEKIIKDCWYVDNISLSTDLKILIKTIKIVLFKTGIYNS